MTKLLLDMGLPRRLGNDLPRDWDVSHVAELGMAKSSDAEILERAQVEHRVVVTLDSDFSMLLAEAKARSPSVMHIRIDRLHRRKAVSVILAVVRVISADLDAGCVASVSEAGVRVRLLPIV